MRSLFVAGSCYHPRQGKSVSNGYQASPAAAQVPVAASTHCCSADSLVYVQDMEANLKALTELTPMQSQCVERAAMLIESLDELEKVQGLESCQVDHVKLLRSSLKHGHELVDTSKDDRMTAVIEEHTVHVLATCSR